MWKFCWWICMKILFIFQIYSKRKKASLFFFLRRTNLIFPTSYTRCKCLRDVSVKHGKFTVQKLSYQKREWQKSQILNIVGNEYSLTGENDFKRRQKNSKKAIRRPWLLNAFWTGTKQLTYDQNCHLFLLLRKTSFIKHKKGRCKRSQKGNFMRLMKEN